MKHKRFIKRFGITKKRKEKETQNGLKNKKNFNNKTASKLKEENQRTVGPLSGAYRGEGISPVYNFLARLSATPGLVYQCRKPAVKSNGNAAEINLIFHWFYFYLST